MSYSDGDDSYSLTIPSVKDLASKPQIVINDLDTTQKVLSEMEIIVKRHKYQFFHDIHEPFQNSQ